MLQIIKYAAFHSRGNYYVYKISFFNSFCALYQFFAHRLLHFAAAFTAAGSAASLMFLTRYKTVFMVIQLFLLGFILTKLVAGYSKKWSFHGAWEKRSYYISLVIVVAGLLVGHFEPFQTEEQKIARQQFQFFKAHKRMELVIAGHCDTRQLREDIESIGGVKSNKIEIGKRSVALVFRGDQVTRSEILYILRSKGYVVLLAE